MRNSFFLLLVVNLFYFVCKYKCLDRMISDNEDGVKVK